MMLLFTSISLPAANFQVSNGELAADQQSISYQVSWDQAWNLDSGFVGNHDAVWFFIKVKYQDDFTHLDLSSADVHTSDNINTLEVRAVPDGKGVFLVPNFSGGGNLGPTKITLKLAEPLQEFRKIEIRAYGIEMVYIPESPFWIGDFTSNNTFGPGAGLGSFRIQSEALLPVGNTATSLSPNGKYAPVADIPASWPKGYGAYYCMKYEISQKQYADFLNSLTFAQQEKVTAISPQAQVGSLALSTGLANRNGIRIFHSGSLGLTDLPAIYGHNLDGNGTFNTQSDGQNRACNWLKWDDLCAYLDWAALRPMTEFEFEKTCRGWQISIPLEYAWGTDEAADANNLHFDGTPQEFAEDLSTALRGMASFGYDGPQGPLRCGFSGGNRLSSGAGFWGAKEMSGNVWEQCVTVNAAGLTFTGELGDGQLSSNGEANVVNWPNANGAGFRGGAWNSGILPGFRDLAVSDRFYAGLAPDSRRNTSGGRGVR